MEHSEASPYSGYQPARTYPIDNLDEKSVHISFYQYKDDAYIWREFKKGSREAFIYIYQKYYPILYNYGHQMTPETEVIEDCIQELFLDLCKKDRKLSDTDSIKYYLLKSFKTRYLRSIKKESRLKASADMYAGHEFLFTLSDEDKLINAQLDQEKLSKLNNALKALTERQREAIYYFYYEQLTLQQIAEIMGSGNPRTIQNLIYRAIDGLRDNVLTLVILCGSLHV
ncbi:MAG: sigma-70 family RNA polymerase sigma factor [Cyclobacteriaceae bacterium]|nr:sigma-70 family RNA polymerase sigma factor [Cyclobacteriaceae bacterium]